MKVLEKFHKDLNIMQSLVERAIASGTATKDDAKAFNNLCIGFKLIKEALIEDLEAKNNIPEELKNIWQEWKLHRHFRGRLYMSTIEEAKAIKKILEIAEGDLNQFTNIVEWAITLGYIDVLPNILNKIEREQKTDKRHLFSESKFKDLNTLLIYLFNQKHYKEINFEEYIRKAHEWSINEDKKKAHWGNVLRSWIDKDTRENKLLRISPAQRKKLTKTDNSQVWKDILSIIKPQVSNQEFTQYFLKLRPTSLFRLTLQLEIPSKDFYDEFENKYSKILKEAIRKNKIYSVEYKLS